MKFEADEQSSKEINAVNSLNEENTPDSVCPTVKEESDKLYFLSQENVIQDGEWAVRGMTQTHRQTWLAD